ncbi:MAG: ribosome maturation factor RimP [Eubacteriales bacterium]
MKQKKNIAGVVREIAEPLAKSFGYILWDVEYVKEGADMILRITIDTDAEGGITIDDCEKMHRAIDPLLDEADPIEDAYMLAVSSPGVERELTQPMHFERMAGEEVEVRLYAAVDGTKTYRGELIGLIDGEVVIRQPDGEEKRFPEKAVAKCTTVFEWD